MGSFGSALGELGAKVLSTGADMLEHTQAVSKILDRTEEGKMWKTDYQNIYLPTKAATVESLSKEALERVKTDPAKPKIDLGEIHTQASKVARHELHGPKDALGVTLASSIEKKHGSVAAQSFSNAVAFLLKDYRDPMAEGTAEGIKPNKNRIQAPYSPFKKEVAKAGVSLSSIEPSYNPRGPIERSVTGAIYQTFSPLLAIPHLGTTFNGLFGSSPDVFLKGLAQSVGKSLDGNIDHFQSLVVSGAFAETHMRDIHEWNQFKATGHPEFSGSGAAHLVYKLFHQPGFSKLRDYTLLSGANVGKMTAEQVAKDFVRNPSDAKTMWQMSEFGLDAKKVLENNGNLDEEDLGRAVYKFVDKHYFLDNQLHRSMLLQSTWAGRILGTYHGYVTRQAKLMARSMFTDMRGQGLAVTMKNLAIGATLFPAMGEGIKLIQESVRGQDAYGDAQKDMQNIEGKHGTGAALATYAEMFGHIGAFGVYEHTLKGALNHSLAQDIAGPGAGAVFSSAQDVAIGGYKTYKSSGKHAGKNFAPLGRDLAYDTPGVSLLSQVLMHRIAPKANDHPKRTVERRLYHHIRHEDLNGNPLPEDNNQ